MLLAKGLSSTKNNYIDLTKMGLEEEEIITNIKINFGIVKEGFSSVDMPLVSFKLHEGLYNNQEIINETILEGYDNTYKISDSDFTRTIVEISPKVETKKLPRTGF